MLALLLINAATAFAQERPAMPMEMPTSAHFHFGGPLGDRVQANLDNWLLRAPLANLGMVEMFRRRDRKPVPELVPWAGEFVGKYLISAVQACRMTDDPRLEPFVAGVLKELISTQAEDGYLGPFRKEERLLGHWDLWGHYHVMLALLMWHERTSDRAALACATKLADLVCSTYLDADRRVFDAGSQEMNMAIIHSLGRLYRLTGAERYLRMVRQIAKEWELPGAGDYLRVALDGGRRNRGGRVCTTCRGLSSCTRSPATRSTSRRSSSTGPASATTTGIPAADSPRASAPSATRTLTAPSRPAARRRGWR